MSRTDRLALPHPATRSLPPHLLSLSAASFARSSYDRCLCQGALLRSRVRSLPPFSQHVRVCCTHTCIYQTGWRVTRCSFLIRMNHEVAEKAHAGGLGLRISAYTMQFLTTCPGSVGALDNTRACRAQANRRAYLSRENARRLFRQRSSRSRRLLVADGNYSSATSWKIQGHDCLACSAAMSYTTDLVRRGDCEKQQCLIV